MDTIRARLQAHGLWNPADPIDYPKRAARAARRCEPQRLRGIAVAYLAKAREARRRASMLSRWKFRTEAERQACRAYVLEARACVAQSVAVLP